MTDKKKEGEEKEKVKFLPQTYSLSYIRLIDKKKKTREQNTYTLSMESSLKRKVQLYSLFFSFFTFSFVFFTDSISIQYVGGKYDNDV